MLKTLFQAFFLVLPLSVVSAQDAAAPAWPAELAAYQLVPAPPQTQKWLQAGDRLAICGDSITEQKQYSVIIETYLTACLPEMEITCRQYGWSGEQAAGFLKRIANDVLRFKPTLATTCYGMNDFRYVPYDEAIAAEYRKNQTAIARIFTDVAHDIGQLHRQPQIAGPGQRIGIAHAHQHAHHGPHRCRHPRRVIKDP